MAPLPPTLASRGLALMQRLATLLLGISILLLVWNHFGMKRVLEFSATSKYQFGLRDDSAEKGASHTVMSTAGKAITLDCTIRQGYAWPYCGFFFVPGLAPVGVDLSGFETVAIDLQKSGPPPHSMRLYTRNFEPDRKSVV